MEFALVALNAAASAAASKVLSGILPKKLGELIQAKKLEGGAKRDANYVKDKLRTFQRIIDDNSSVGSPLPRDLLAPLWRLAYEIEDCIACFQVEKMTSQQFAEEIARLNTRCAETRQEFRDNIGIQRGMQNLGAVTSSSAQGQGQQQAAPTAAFEVLIGKNGEDWPNNLNRLLYFRMFPHDYEARRNPLIRRWLAEGLVGGEAKAKQYLEDLIDGEFINTTVKSNNGMMKRCQPPDGVHELIRQQSSYTNFMLFCEDMTNLEADCVRRLSLRPSDEILHGMNLSDSSYLHTLAVFSANPAIYETFLEFRKYEVLRVLDLKECAPLSKRHLSQICNLLLLLKYLSFKAGVDIDRLPKKIRNLAWLETLDMRESKKVVAVKKQVLMMPNLKHLLGKFELHSSIRDTLRTVLGLMTTELGRSLKEKSVLQTLSGFVTDDSRRGFPLLMILMSKLKKVKIWCERNASEATLGDVSRAIAEFILVCDGNQDPGRSLSIDFQQCSGHFLNNLEVKGGGLTSLKLHGHLTKFPQFAAQLSCVQELCLSSTALSWSLILAGLSKLRILKYLTLVEDKLGVVQILENDLRSLERLCLVCVSNLKITIQAGALPSLVSLHLICQDLEVLPGNTGMEIKHMTKLQDVGLHSKVGREIKKEWETYAQDVHPNEPRVCDVQPPNVGNGILH